MATQLTHFFTADEFLDAYGNREDRVEYRDGQMFQMEAVTPNHGIITANLARVLGNQLGNSTCVLYSTPFVRTKDPVYQPDLAVGCEKAEFFKDALLNPTLIIEVLSPTTEDFDRGSKFADYRSISGLREYLTVSQKEIWVEQRVREDDRWVLTDHRDPQVSVQLASVQAVLRLSDIYAKVNWETASTQRS